MPALVPLSQTIMLALLAAPPSGPIQPGRPHVLDADIAPYHGLTIGGTFAAWGTAVHIQPARAFAIERGKCAFRIGYEMVNTGQDTTSMFSNTLTAGAAVLDTKDNLHLTPRQNVLLGAQAWLAPGTVDLIVHLDDGNAVPETNEQNNVARVRVTLDGTCLGAPAHEAAPGQPGQDKAQVPFVPPGSINSADQTDDTPTPVQPASGNQGYGVPDTRGARAAIIINDCQAALTRRLGTAARGVIAKCDGSVMTLMGRVPTPEAKAAAERAARSVPGVTGVNDQLIVAQGNL